jgi:hypothetical protein
MKTEFNMDDILRKAYEESKGDSVVKRSIELIENGVEKNLAFYIAYLEVSLSMKQEIESKDTSATMRFTEDDIVDKARLERMILKEAEAIFNSATARHGRDLESIKLCVRQGKVAELYLIEKHGYMESDKKWHDLVDHLGDYVEVKAYTNSPRITLPYVEKDLRKIRTEGWNTSKWYILFNVNDGVYELVEKVKIK